MYPVIARFGPMMIYAYGLFVAIGFLIGMLVAQRLARRVGIDPRRIATLSCWLLISGLIGARLWYVFQHWSAYAPRPWEIVMVHQGGLVFYGGWVTALLVGWWSIRRQGWSFWTVADLMAPAAALGHGIGRIGCLLNGCCHGKPPGIWIFPWQPTQLYEAMGLVLVAVLLMRMIRRMPPGMVFFLYIEAYAMLRLIVEFWRGDDRPFLGPLSVPQWVSLAILIIASFALARFFPRAAGGKRKA